MGETSRRARHCWLMHLRQFLAVGPLLFAVAGCTDPPPEAVDPAAAPAGLSVPTGDGGTAAGGASPNLAVEVLLAQDIREAALDGELGCAFTPSLRGETLFLASAYVGDGEGGEGVIRLPEGLHKLAMEGSGGFDAMRRGARFTGGGLTLTIARTSEQNLPQDPPIAEESPAFPARMTLAGGGGEVLIEGVYECGP